MFQVALLSVEEELVCEYFQGLKGPTNLVSAFGLNGSLGCARVSGRWAHGVIQVKDLCHHRLVCT